MLLALLTQTLIDLTDESIEIFDVCMASRHKKARKALAAYHNAMAETTETHSQLLQAIGDVVLDDTVTDERLRQAIYYHIPRDTLQAAVQEARTLRRPNGHLDFLDDHYSYIRQFAPQFLSTLAFESHQDEDPVLQAVEVLRSLNTTKRRKLPEDVPVNFVPDNWRRLVMANDPPDRRPYELCALSTLRDKLRAGDIYLPHSRRYTDPETFLIPKIAMADTATRRLSRTRPGSHRRSPSQSACPRVASPAAAFIACWSALMASGWKRGN